MDRPFRVGDKVRRTEPGPSVVVGGIYIIANITQRGFDLVGIKSPGHPNSGYYAEAYFELVEPVESIVIPKLPIAVLQQSVDPDNLNIDIWEDIPSIDARLKGLFAMKHITFTGTNLIECVEALVVLCAGAQNELSRAQHRAEKLERIVRKTASELLSSIGIS